MRHILLICFTVSLLAGGYCLAQDQPAIDTILYPNLGPYEARGTVEPIKHHIPFHQHLWKVIEYPIEGVARVATAPLMLTSHLIPRDYRIGHLTQIFYFDDHNGYIFPSFTAQSDRGVDCAIALHHDSFPLQSVGVGAEMAYGGRTEHSFGFRIDEKSLAGRGIAFSLTGQLSRRPDRYFYGIGIDSREDGRSAFTLKELTIRADWSFRAFSEFTVEPVLEYRRTELRQGEMDCSPLSMSELHNYNFVLFELEKAFAAGGGFTYDNRPERERSVSGSIISGRVIRSFSDTEFRIKDSDYWRYSGAVKHHIKLPGRQRSLQISALMNGVRLISNKYIPFWNLPTLGGMQRLRGYPPDRFRDNIAFVSTVEYNYSIFQKLRGRLFVDFGSVAPAWEAFDLKDFKTGYGFELKTDLDNNFAFDFQIAHSREGLQLYVGTSSRLSVLSGEMNR